MPFSEALLPGSGEDDAKILAKYHLILHAAQLAQKDGEDEVAASLMKDAHAAKVEADKYVEQQSGMLDPLKGASMYDHLGAQFQAGLRNVGRHVMNSVGALSDEDLAERSALDKPLKDESLGAFSIGEAAPLAPMGAGVSGTTARVLPWLRSLVANPVVRGAIEGGAQGAVMSDPGHKGYGTLVGAGAGAVLPAAAATGSRIVSGATRTPEAALLANKLPPGTLTPGQMNPGGVASHLEQIPGVSWLYERAKANARQQYTRVAAERAAMPGTTIQPGDKANMLQQAYDSFEPYYDAGKGFPVGAKIMNANGPDVPLAQALARAARAPGATPERQAAGRKWLLSELQARVNQAVKSGKGLLSDDLLALRSDIRAQRAKYAAMDGTDADDLATIYSRANDEVTAAIHSQIPASAKASVQLADSNYGRYKTFEEAVGRSKDAPYISPQHLSNAVQRNTNNGPYARGSDPTRDRVRTGPGQIIEVPNTGLRDLGVQGNNVFAEDPRMRTGASNPPAAAMAWLGHQFPAAVFPAGVGATLLGTTAPGRRLAQGVTAPQIAFQGMLDRARARPGISRSMSAAGTMLERLATLRALTAQGTTEE